ncbi:hypothetical protein AeRB84_014560 [Aphanomyces euteiches]|nr:hypothetical protein AeRB84_014560 [Aphanomyces euteiches]
MNKVEQIRLPTAAASCSRWSLAYNAMVVMSLASTPLLAYLTEPHPGLLDSRQLPPWNSFEDFVNETAEYFKIQYSHEALQRRSRRDITTNTFALRREMAIPHEVPQIDVMNWIIRMPASLFFGAGIRNYLQSFIMANTTRRAQMQPWQMCQHDFVLTNKMSELCIWLEPSEPNSYNVWAATAVLESSLSSWLKLIFRCLLTVYVLFVLWKRYYRHYITLLNNLRQIGLSRQYGRYKIVVGDPAYAILSDPVVSLAMVIDSLWSLSYIAVALIQLARCVWYGYLFMRIFSAIAKKYQWEASFSPVDPGFLSICAYIYAGPIMSFMGTTQLVQIFHVLWSLFLPEEMKYQAIEGITATVFVFFIQACIPLIFSGLSKWPKCIRVYPVHAIRRRASDYNFNDLKARILLAITLEKSSKHSSGGSLHNLYQENMEVPKTVAF